MYPHIAEMMRTLYHDEASVVAKVDERYCSATTSAVAWSPRRPL